MSKGKNGIIHWKEAPDIERRVKKLLAGLELAHVKKARVFCYRSTHAKTRAYARIWGLGRIWQQALGLEPAYVLEVISERFDKLAKQEQDMVLIHELLHIPKTFSGALLPHRRRGGVNDVTVRQLYRRIQNLKIKNQN